MFRESFTPPSAPSQGMAIDLTPKRSSIIEEASVVLKNPRIAQYASRSVPSPAKKLRHRRTCNRCLKPQKTWPRQGFNYLAEWPCYYSKTITEVKQLWHNGKGRIPAEQFIAAQSR